MYTLYTSVGKSLPTTSYMKAVEWWLMYHIVVPFIMFIVLFLDEHKSKIMNKLNLKNPDLVNKVLEYLVFFGKFVLPFVSIFFVLIFSLIVFLHF